MILTFERTVWVFARVVAVTAFVSAVHVVVAPPAVATQPSAPRGDTRGAREIRGRVYDLSAGPDGLIAGATVSYVHFVGTERAAADAIRSDGRGEFVFTRALRDSDLIRITATAPGYETLSISASAGDLIYRFPVVEFGLMPVADSVHRVAGHLSSDSSCARRAGGAVLTLQPTGRSTLTAADGTFAFEHVANGDYVLHVDSSDADIPVTVAGKDALVQYCVDCGKHDTTTSGISAAPRLPMLTAGQAAIVRCSATP
jgi:hypothetical protein